MLALSLANPGWLGKGVVGRWRNAVETCRALATTHHDDAPHVLHAHLRRDVHAKWPAVVPALCVNACAVLGVAVLRAGRPSMRHPAQTASFHAGSIHFNNLHRATRGSHDTLSSSAGRFWQVMQCMQTGCKLLLGSLLLLRTCATLAGPRA